MNIKGKTFFLDQHGCAKNQVDGELLINNLTKAGMLRTEDPSSADLIIVNSCGFINSAKEESLNSVIDARSSYPNAKILLAGCLAERYAEDLSKELSEADGFFGNGDLSKVTEVVDELFCGQRPVERPTQQGVCCGDRDFLLSFKGSAYVKITEGCDNCCSFCAIPIIRGRLRSSKICDIIQEIENFVKIGIKEINLIGQDLAAYGCGSSDKVLDSETPKVHSSFLEQLLERISAIEGDFWVRLLYIHPDHFNKDILNIIKRDKRFLPYFDIPFQSGSNGIIQSMNRKGTFDSYLELVNDIRRTLPEACIRTTFLTGFPGESKDDAKQTEEFLKAIQSDWSGCFTYSREEGTPADLMQGHISAKLAKERAQRLENLQAEITRVRLQQRCGKVYDVLVEEIILIYQKRYYKK